uniref:Vitamin K epoxide reductase domain-containing protein n=1 Tax=Salix viminalis TaxID=40686 RepID=A0A6N2N436_SALVM
MPSSGPSQETESEPPETAPSPSNSLMSSSSVSTYNWCAGLGGVGFLETAYLTFLKLTNSDAFCPIGGGNCGDVLSSDYAVVFGVPLPLIGMISYGLVAALGLQLSGKKLPFGIDESNGRLLLLGCTTSMAAASGYFLYILANIDLEYFTTEITTPSSPFAISLARHLQSIGAKMYGAFWCSHCQEQKQIFGKEATELLNYVECFPDGFRKGSKMIKACADAKLEGFPTWVINGQVLSGDQELSELAKVSEFKIEESNQPNIKLIRTDTTLDLSQKAEKGVFGTVYSKYSHAMKMKQFLLSKEENFVMVKYSWKFLTQMYGGEVLGWKFLVASAQARVTERLLTTSVSSANKET